MTIRINNLSLSLDDDISLLKKKVSKKLRISENEIKDLEQKEKNKSSNIILNKKEELKILNLHMQLKLIIRMKKN